MKIQLVQQQRRNETQQLKLRLQSMPAKPLTKRIRVWQDKNPFRKANFISIDYGTHILIGSNMFTWKISLYHAANGRITNEIPFRELHNGMAMHRIAEILCSIFPGSLESQIESRI